MGGWLLLSIFVHGVGMVMLVMVMEGIFRKIGRFFLLGGESW
jgi:hypothetical protein